MARLDIDRQTSLEPIRTDKVIEELHLMGFDLIFTNSELKCISFEFKGQTVTYYPYSGWATGRSIKDGRGLENLLKQLTK